MTLATADLVSRMSVELHKVVRGLRFLYQLERLVNDSIRYDALAAQQRGDVHEGARPLWALVLAAWHVTRVLVTQLVEDVLAQRFLQAGCQVQAFPNT
jgi:hypothetical protein